MYVLTFLMCLYVCHDTTKNMSSTIFFSLSLSKIIQKLCAETVKIHSDKTAKIKQLFQKMSAWSDFGDSFGFFGSNTKNKNFGAKKFKFAKNMG